MKSPVLYSHFPLSETFELALQKPWEPGEIPAHHTQWFKELLRAAKNGHLGLMACREVATGEIRSVIAVMHHDFDGNVNVTPLGHLCPLPDPFQAYVPPLIEEVKDTAAGA